MGAISARGRSGIPPTPEGLPSTCQIFLLTRIGFLPANSNGNHCAVTAGPAAELWRILVNIW